MHCAGQGLGLGWDWVGLGLGWVGIGLGWDWVGIGLGQHLGFEWTWLQ